ncbi:MAG: isocitrate/isopropylmalate dehydrogenase family protein [Caldivirga sp.]|uniref:isocitrate/isopropylmalate dehydrogenase family protein n=1 Tax=Caldivirga sp. MU80 TaxID=1650354 RepID=UPI000A06522E|nr:isocitrate/isopropylmalate dehydrogenase family protein [Caldivirga sp. MU80]
MRIAVIKGDGIGPEVVDSALRVLKAAAAKYGLAIEPTEVEAGDTALSRYGEAMPSRYWGIIEASDAILKGPVGESAGEVVVKLRRGLDLYANIRPARVYPGVKALREGVDLVIVRENTEDVYVRAEYMVTSDVAVALRVISRRASERIAKVAFELAKSRRGKVTVVHKANVLTVTDGLFRSVAREVASRYPNVKVDEMYIDSAVMDMVRRPQDFDVILTTNLYGDILSDIAAYVTGSIGLAPSANMGDSKAMFEPVHGAAFDIAGKGIANPTATILCASWMLKWWGSRVGDGKYTTAGNAIEKAVLDTLSSGAKLTPDLGGNATTAEFADEVIKRI